jgi:hypothetical protein
MFKISICTYPDKDEEKFPEVYESSIEAIAAFKERFDATQPNMGLMPNVELYFNDKRILSEAKPMHRDLDMMQVFQKVSGAI